MQNKKDLLLKGLRVADFSRILVGAYSSMLLADMGAEVIKLEPPVGDETRTWGPPFRGNDSTYYLSINRNKKSIGLDLKKDKAQKIALDLVEKSDILIENFTYGKMKEFNLDYESVKKINPKIIYTTVNSYGNLGPMRKDPAFDLIIQSYCGVMNITGGEDTEPYKVGYPMCDIMSGAHVYSAILAALLHKNNSGEGQYINTSLLEVNLFSMPTIASAYLNGNVNNKRRGNDHPSISPYTVFKLQDGEYVSIGVATDSQFAKLWKVLKLDKAEADYKNKDINKNISLENKDLISYEKYSSNKLRIKYRKDLKDIIQKQLLLFHEKYIFEYFKKFGIPFSKINSMKDLFENYDCAVETEQTNQLKALDLVKEIETKYFGKLKYIRNPITYEKIDVKTVETPPLYGEHTKDILKNILNYKDEEIENYLKEKIIF